MRGHGCGCDGRRAGAAAAGEPAVAHLTTGTGPGSRLTRYAEGKDTTITKPPASTAA
jgi:hypothetical protein